MVHIAPFTVSQKTKNTLLDTTMLVCIYFLIATSKINIKLFPNENFTKSLIFGSIYLVIQKMFQKF
tara:strand:- start:520 stop:717 length:198 start_codon:yes stop_codon:yes gene_type:complete